MENCEYLAKFEAHLVKAPYFNGKRPGFIDVHIFENLELPDKFKFPLTHNWYTICSVFHPTVRESWKVIKGKNAANFGIEHHGECKEGEKKVCPKITCCKGKKTCCKEQKTCCKGGETCICKGGKPCEMAEEAKVEEKEPRKLLGKAGGC